MIRFCCEFTLFGGFRVTKVWQPPAARVELVRISGKLPTSVHEPASPQPHRTKTGISRQNRVAASGQPHQIPYFLRIIPPPAEFFFASWSVVAVSHLALQAVHHLSLQPVAVTELADPALSDVATSTPPLSQSCSCSNPSHVQFAVLSHPLNLPTSLFRGVIACS
ncbi:hypothetical protein DTO164E3_5744 [Paecilomyces variotii]|nr:hypothetical protein DTO164E3_5744 [Paecilomyces variotii]